MNSSGDLFGETKIATDEVQTHIFKNLPLRIDRLRIDPAHKSGLPVIVKDIRVKTSSDYFLRPNRDVLVVNVSEWRKWQFFDLKPKSDGPSFVSTTNDPKLVIPLSANLEVFIRRFDLWRNGAIIVIAASAFVAVFL